MRNHDYIPSGDERFHSWQETFMAYLIERLAAYGLTTEEYDTLAAPQAEWRTAWEVANNPATRTSPATLAKDNARNAYEHTLRAFVRRYLNENPAVTGPEREKLGLPVYKTERTPVPVPTEAPSFEVDTSQIRELHIHYHPAGAKRDGAKPFGVHGVELRWAILDAPPSDDIETDLLHSSFDTRSPIVLTFKEGQRGKTVYFALRWENTRGDKGPWGDIGSSIIP
ncbi:hypothetical protein OpiT1DRAFT_00138 [Opitutaceae bacterium TAV1]|nr:hypothetical protein OpiT1DRAFT_00138 [Opitutaceae bacterium TAV1]